MLIFFRLRKIIMIEKPYLFFSWHSSYKETNKNFLTEILKELSQEFGYDFRSDTRAVTGHVEVTETILREISQASIYICDVTVINIDQKLCNSNVMLELGHALHSVGSSNIICVLNLAHGTCEQLPFNLVHHRWPVQYTLLELSTRNDVKKKLKSELKQIVENIDINSTNFVEKTIRKIDQFSFDIMSEAGCKDYLSLNPPSDSMINDHFFARTIERMLDLELI